MEHESFQEDRAQNPARRTVLVGAAWSVPVIAAAVAAPMASASTDGRVLTFTQALGTIGACDANPTGVIRLTDAGGAGIPTTSVAVTLPTGLVWADGTSSSTKSFTSDASGYVSLVGQIRGTGSARIYTVVATSTGATDATASIQTTVALSAIYYSGNASTVSPADTAGVVVNPVALAVASNYAYARDSSGGWYVHFGAVDGDWKKFTGVPSVDTIVVGAGGDYGYAVAGGQVYRGAPGGASVHLSGISGVTKLAQTGGRLFAVGDSGTVQRRYLADSSWSQVLISGTTTPLGNIVDLDGNEGGGYGWAISGTDIYYMLDNNLAYLSTTTSQKPANPVELNIGAGWAYVRDADGSVWSHAGATAGNWYQLAGLPGAATRISSNEGGDFIWALVDGRLYSSAGTAAFTLADSASSPLPGAIVDFAIGSGWAYAKLADGTFWSKAGAGAGAWKQMTGTPGNTVDFLTTNFGSFSWFIADNSQSC